MKNFLRILLVFIALGAIVQTVLAVSADGAKPIERQNEAGPSI